MRLENGKLQEDEFEGYVCGSQGFQYSFGYQVGVEIEKRGKVKPSARTFVKSYFLARAFVM